MSKRSERKPQVGDLVLVVWIDITGTSTGDLKEATTTLCATPGFFVGYRKTKGVKTLVVAPNAHIAPEWQGSTGWDAYPAAVVKAVKVLLTKEEVMEMSNGTQS